MRINRLSTAGFPLGVVVGVVESLVKVFRGHFCSKTRKRPTSRHVVLPYVHRMSHGIKKVASRYDVPVVFSAPSKLSQLCATISRGG